MNKRYEVIKVNFELNKAWMVFTITLYFAQYFTTTLAPIESQSYQ